MNAMARPIRVIPLMATLLNDELQNRGIFTINHAECEKIITKVMERSGEAARRIERREANRS